MIIKMNEVNKIISKIEPVGRKLQPMDIVQMRGIVKNVEDNRVEIRIGEIYLQDENFSGSTANWKQDIQLIVSMV
jgi:hypothetical protein